MGMMGPTSMFVNYFLEISQVDYVDETNEAAIKKNQVYEGYNIVPARPSKCPKECQLFSLDTNFLQSEFNTLSA